MKLPEIKKEISISDICVVLSMIISFFLKAYLDHLAIENLQKEMEGKLSKVEATLMLEVQDMGYKNLDKEMNYMREDIRALQHRNP